MKTATRPIRDQDELNRGKEDRYLGAEKREEPRARALLFACASEEAQLMTMYSDRMEITYLPNCKMEEVRGEIERCKPKLIVCGAGAFLDVLASQSPGNASRPREDIPRISSDGAHYRFARREMKILVLLTKGKTNNDIAKSLFLSSRTVKRILSSLFEQLQVTNRTELVGRVSELSLLEKDI